MKLTPAFFHEEGPRQFLERAAAIMSIPLCIHGKNNWHIAGWGACAACEWVNKQSKGQKSCRASREEYLEVVKSQEAPVTFVCHMGFTCMIAAIVTDDNFTLTLGPYLLEKDTGKTACSAEKSLCAFNKTHVKGTGLPFTLDDIRIASQGTILAGAEWILEGLRALLNDSSREEGAALEEDPISQKGKAMPPPRRAARGECPEPNHVEVSIMALALLCGRTMECRAFLVDLVEENKRHPGQIKARMMRVLSELFDAVKHQGGDIQKAWNAYTAFVEAANTLNAPEDLLNAAEKVLRRIARTCSAEFTGKNTYMPAVVTALHGGYTGKRLLVKTAATADVAASTITRSLEQKTGATFSEVLGRIRILHACRLLRTTSLPVTSIAGLVGIHDQANFSKLFLRYRGEPPGAYRARFRK